MHTGDCRNGVSLRERITAGTGRRAREPLGGKWAEQDTPSCHTSLSGSVFVLPASGGNKPFIFLFCTHLSHFLLLSFLIRIFVIPLFFFCFFFVLFF